MNPSLIIAILGIAVTVLLTVSGWVIGHLLTRLRTADELVSTHRDIIADLRSQRDKLQVAAEMQDKFFSVVLKQSSDKG